VFLEEENEIANYNSFLEKLWPKYHYVIMRQMGAKFKRDIEKIEDEDEYFDALPETCMQSANEHEYYSNFVLSDMTIEVIRAVKVKVITDHLVSLPKKVVNLVMYWAIENILNEDESNIYNDISIEAG